MTMHSISSVGGQVVPTWESDRWSAIGDRMRLDVGKQKKKFMVWRLHQPAALFHLGHGFGVFDFPVFCAF